MRSECVSDVNTLRFIIAQVQDDFYGNVGTYITETRLTENRYVDNKNRVLSLRTVATVTHLDNRWFESTLGHKSIRIEVIADQLGMKRP